MKASFNLYTFLYILPPVDAVSFFATTVILEQKSRCLRRRKESPTIKLHNLIFASMRFLNQLLLFTLFPPFVAASQSHEVSPTLLAKIRKRHDEAVQSARNAYDLSAPTLTDDEAKQFDTSKIKFHSISVPKPSAIPDFHTSFPNPCIHTSSPDTPLFSKEDCNSIIDAANRHFQETNNGQWTTLQSGRHPVCGFWIKDVPAVHDWFRRMLVQKLFPHLRLLFPDFVQDVGDLVCDNAYLFKYTTETGQKTDVHTDSGCLSFTIALNDRKDYEGGGTWFDLGFNCDQDSDSEPDNSIGGKVIHMEQGGVTFRPGGIRHRGESVTGGERYIIGGFVMNLKKIEKVRMLMGLAMDLVNQNKLHEAEELLRVAIRINPHFDAAYINLSDILTKLNQEEDSMKVLQKVMEVNPLNGEAAYSLGMMNKARGDYESAKQCFDACLRSDKYDSEAMLAHATTCAEAKDLEGEQKWFTKVISTPGVQNSTLASAYSNLGVLIGEKGDRDGEVAMYEKALTLDPDSFHARYSLAIAYGESSEYSKSIDSFRLAVDMAPSSDLREKALKDLYRITAMKVNNDPNIQSMGQEQVMAMFTECIGEENFKELMSVMRR